MPVLGDVEDRGVLGGSQPARPSPSLQRLLQTTEGGKKRINPPGSVSPLFSPPFQVIAGKLNRIQGVFPFQNALERRRLNPFSAPTAAEWRFRGASGGSGRFAEELRTAQAPPKPPWVLRGSKMARNAPTRSCGAPRGRFWAAPPTTASPSPFQEEDLGVFTSTRSS